MDLLRHVRAGRLATGLLVGIATGLVLGATPHAVARTAIQWGGEWTSAGNASFYDQTTDLQASTSLRLQAQAGTYLWRALLAGRVGAYGPLTGGGNWETKGELDRLYLRLYLPSADLSMGKQAINWGVGYAWDPTDVFNPPDVQDPEGVRPGIIAAVAQVPVGPLAYWSVVAAGEQYGIRRRGNYKGTDWSVLAVRDGADTVVGADAKGDLGIGWHTAAAYRIPDERLGEGAGTGPEPSWQGLIGADYSWLLGNVVWRGEYVFGSPNELERNRTFQQLTVRVDEFTSVFGSILSDLSRRSHMWNAGVTTFLGGQSQLTVGVTAWTGQTESPVAERTTARATAEITHAF